MKKAGIGPLLLLLLVLLSLSGCEDTSVGKTLRYDLDRPVDNLDPQFTTDAQAQMVLLNVFEGLLVEQPDGTLAPGVAKTYTVSDGGRLYRFALREAFWSDGEAVTAKDFVFAFRRLFGSQAVSPLAWDYENIENGRAILAGEATPYRLGVLAVDDHTLEIRLDRDDPLFLYKLAQPAALPCREDYFQNSQGRYGLPGNLLGNGPFLVSAWDNQQYIILKPNEHYQSELPVIPGGVSLYIGRGDSAELFLDGRSDLVALSAGEYRELGREDGRDTAYEQTVWCLVFQQDDAVWGSALLRQGLFTAIDYQELQANLPQGLRTTSQFIPPAARVGNRFYRELAGAVEPVAYDLERAAYLFELGLQGRELHTAPASVLYVPDTGGHSLYLGSLQRGWQQNLAALISLEQMPVEELTDRAQRGDYGMMLLPFSSAQMDVSAMLGAFASRSEQNTTGYGSLLYDQLLEEVRDYTTLEDMAERCARAEWQLLSDAVVIPLYVETTYYAAAPGVSGIQVFPDGGRVLFQHARKE